MLIAQRAHQNGDYARCEKFYHQALRLLSESKFSGARAYQEGRTVILDKVHMQYTMNLIVGLGEKPHHCLFAEVITRSSSQTCFLGVHVEACGVYN